MPKINVNPTVALDAYASQMLQEKGALTDDEQQNAAKLNQLRTQLDEVIDRAVIDALPEEKLPELEELLNRDASDAEIDKFFVNSGADFEGATKAALERFRLDYLNGKSDETQVNSTMTNTINSGVVAATPAGNPMQGASSEVPGASNVEGVAEQTTVVSEEEI